MESFDELLEKVQADPNIAFDELLEKVQEAPTESFDDTLSKVQEAPTESFEDTLSKVQTKPTGRAKRYPRATLDAGKPLEELLPLEMGGARTYSDSSLDTRIAKAEYERRKTLAIIEKNEKIEEEAKKLAESGVSPDEVEKFKQSQGHEEGSWWKGALQTIPRLSQTESTLPIDIERAKTGAKSNIAPLKVWENALQDLSESWDEGKLPSPTDWFELDKDVRKRVKEELKLPIIDGEGNINYDALSKSNLSRADQNEVALDFAEDRTGISKEIWRELLNKRFGVNAEDGTIQATGKRIKQVVDSFFANIPSAANARWGDLSPIKKLDELKKMAPLIDIQIVRTPEGKVFTQAGVEIEDAEADDTDKELYQKGWEATVDQMAGLVEGQAMENWTMVGDVALSMTGAGILKTAAGGLAKAAAKKGAVSGTIKALGAVSGAGGKLLGQTGETLLKLANQGGRIRAAEQAGSKTLKTLRAIDRVVSPIATTATMQAIGAPRGASTEAFIGGAVMGAGMKAVHVPLSKMVGDIGPLAHMAEEKKALKSIIRTEKFEDLPRYTKKYFDKRSGGMDYGEFRAQAGNLLSTLEKVKPYAKRMIEGDFEDKVFLAYLDAISNDEKARSFIDNLSRAVDPDSDMSATGRFRNEFVLDNIVASADKHLSTKIAENEKAGNGSLDGEIQLLQIMQKKFKRAAKDIPSEILNGSKEQFQAYIDGVDPEGTQKLKYMGMEIKEIMEGTAGGDPYQLFAVDLIKMFVIADEAKTPVQFIQLMKYMRNAPKLQATLDAMEKASRETTRNPFTGQVIDRVDPKATRSHLINSPEGIKEALRLAQETEGARLGLEEDLRKERSLPGRIREARRGFERKIKDRRIQASVSREELERTLDRAVKNSDRHLAKLTESRGKGAGGGPLLSILDELRNTTARLEGDETRQGAQRVLWAVKRLSDHKYITDDQLKFLPKEARKWAKMGSDALKDSHEATREGMVASKALATIDQRLKDLNEVRRMAMELNLTEGMKGKVAGVMTTIFDNLPAAMNDVALKGNKYFQNVVYLIAKDIHDSASDSGFIVQERHIGMLRLLENPSRLEDILGIKLDRKHAARIGSEIRDVVDTLHAMSTDSAGWRAEITKLSDMMGTREQNISSIAGQIAYMRDGFKVAKLSKEIQQKSAQLYDLAEKIRVKGGSKVSPADMKLLTWFAKSTMVERLRMAKNPDWIVTYKGELDNVFRSMQEQLPGLHQRGVDLVAQTTGVDPASLDATIISSWFINPKNTYDGAGRLRLTLAMAEYWKQSEGGLWAAGVGEMSRAGMSQEMFSTILSRDTATSVEKDVQLIPTLKRKAKAIAERIFVAYNKEVQALTYNGKRFDQFESKPDFVNLIKRLTGGIKGFTANHYLVLDGKLTAIGQIVQSWADYGFSKATLDKLIAFHRDTLAVGLDEDGLRKLDGKMSDLRNDILTYLPSNNENFLGVAKDISADDYGMAIEFLKVHQKWDKIKLEERNKANAAENKRNGTDFPEIRYFPHRIDAGSQLLTKLTDEPTSLDHPASHVQLFGRMIGSTVEGQVAKAQGVNSEIDLRHPMENFYIDTHKLFQAVLTRDPWRRLNHTLRVLERSGYDNATSAAIAHLMGVSLDDQAGRGASIPKAYTDLMDKNPMGTALRVIGIPLNPAIRLASPHKILLENPIQAAVSGITTNPRSAIKEAMSTVLFFPKFFQHAYLRILEMRRKGKDPLAHDVAIFRTMAGSLPPEYLKELSFLSEGINPEKNVKAEEGLKRINWETNRWMKRLDVQAGDRVGALFAAEQALFKENSEKVALDTRLQSAGHIYQNITNQLISMTERGTTREEMIRVADRALKGKFSGALANDTMNYRFATEFADNVIAGNPLAGLQGFATVYSNQQLGRFDASNVPPMIRALARWKPGAAQFFNPLTNGAYRVGLVMHSAMGRRGSAAASDVAATAMSLTCMLGATMGASYLANYYGTVWFSRLGPVAGSEGLYNLVTDPTAALGGFYDTLSTAISQGGAGSRGGGDMVLRAYLTVIGNLTAYWAADVAAEMDGTSETDAHEKRQTKRLQNAFDVIYSSSPVAILTDSFVNAPKWGWAQWDNKDFVSAANLATLGEDMRDGPRLKPEDVGGVTKSLEVLGKATNVLLRLSNTEEGSDVDYSPEALGEAYGAVGINIPGSVLNKIIDTLSKRREAAESKDRRLMLDSHLERPESLKKGK